MKISFNSIQTKLSILTLVGIIFSTGLIGSFGLYYTASATDKNTATTMNAVCQQEAAKLDALFLRIEQSVDIMAYKALGRENIAELLQSKEEADHYLEEMETILLGALGSTEGVVAAYLRFSPEIASADSSIFYVKEENGQDQRREEKDIFIKHYIGSMMSLEWYDRPIEEGGPVWLLPYKDNKINDQVISYAMPLYQEGVLIGVVGMDVLFADIVKEVDSISIYETGYGYLITESNEMVYHPFGEDSFSISRKHEEWDEYVALLGQKQEKDFIFSYRYDGRDKKMTYSILENGMLLLVTAPVAETDAEKYELISTLVITITIITVICFIFILLYTRSIITPLKELTKAAKQVAEGKMDVVLVNQSQDEVGELSASFQQTVDCLKIYMDRMSELAYRDPLTGVKSKAAYAEEIKKINNSIKLGFDQFGIMMLDINELKRVNDQYGHEVGDSYIINCCKLICTIFKHSPVFRIGGDEFIALLIGEDLKNVDRLLERFDIRMMEIQREATCPEEMVSIAAGYAIFDETSDQAFEDVFKRADESMYKKKVSMKEGIRD